MTCLFCAIVAGDIPSQKIYEDDDVFAFLDIHPVSDGHTLIIPKVHAINLSEGTVDDAEKIMRAVYRLAPGIMRAVGADGYNLGMNHGESAGQEVSHTHVHLMPRKAGVSRRFVRTNPTAEELSRIADAIRAALE